MKLCKTFLFIIFSLLLTINAFGFITGVIDGNSWLYGKRRCTFRRFEYAVPGRTLGCAVSKHIRKLGDWLSEEV